MSGAPFSLPVLLARIPPAGKHFHIGPDDRERRAIADHLKILDLKDLTADLQVRPVGAEAFAVQGELKASVVQTDVVTLEPVPQEMTEEIDMILQPAESISAKPLPAAGAEIADERDVYHGGRIDLGAIVVEHLALGLDPYPRSTGVEFPGHVEDVPDAESSPFAALAKLKRGQE